jgi:YVTN family beta-propeller protein
MRTRRTSREVKVNRRSVLVSASGVLLLALAAGFAARQAPGIAAPLSQDPDTRYLSPVALQLSPDGQRLYVVCEESDVVLAVSTRSRQVVGRLQVGPKAKGIAVSPDGKTIYVTNEWNNTVTEIDADSFRIRRTLETGWGPVGVVTGRTGKYLYVANTLGDDASVIDLATGKELKRLNAGHFPEYIVLSRDGSQVYVSNLLARIEPYNRSPVSQLTVIDTRKQIVSDRLEVPGVLQLRHIAEVPQKAGNYLLIPFMRPHNLIPLIQIQQGWYMTHGMAIVRPPRSSDLGKQKPRVMEVSLDGIDRSFADGFGAASTPDGRWALVTASGADVVSIIDTRKLDQAMAQVPASEPDLLADRLDAAHQFVAARLHTGRNPAAAVVSPDGRFAYIANRMDDSVSVVDMRELKISATIDLGGPRVTTAIRNGARLFYDASYCYQGQMACASCHPHGGLSDGLAWSLETPQLGRDDVENRTLLAIADTSPFKWNGLNLSLDIQDGPRTAMYIFRSQGFSPEGVKDLVSFLDSLKLPPNPYLAPDGELTETQEMGRKMFFRSKANDGRLIPVRDRCYFCHAPQTHYTSRVRMDVGTATQYDTIKEFDIPQIESVYMRPPYLHNGEALTLEEIWTKFNPEDKHGITSDMNKVQLNELIEFLKTL